MLKTTMKIRCLDTYGVCRELEGLPVLRMMDKKKQIYVSPKKPKQLLSVRSYPIVCMFPSPPAVFSSPFVPQ